MQDDIITNDKIVCNGCLKDTLLKDIKRVGIKTYCPICYSYIISI